MTKKHKILFTTPLLKYPYAGGPEMSVHNAIKALSQVSDVHIISRMTLAEMGGVEALNYYKKHCSEIHFSPSGLSMPAYTSNKYLRFLQRKLNPNRKDMLDAAYIINYARKNKIDIIWCDRHEFSFELICSLKKKGPSLKIVCDTAAVHSQFILRALPFQTDLNRRRKIEEVGLEYERQEKILVNLCDIMTAVSLDDAKVFQSWSGHPNRVHLFPNVVDLECYVRDEKNVLNIKSPSIVAAGTFYSSNSPMEHGTRWIINEVLPKVRKKIPNLYFYIVGKNSDTILRDIKDPNIIVTGRVNLVEPYFSNADIGIVPLKFESGTRFKILEYGALELPTISTTLGAEGLLYEEGREIVIADEVNDFANSIIKLIQNKDERKQLGKNLHELVKSKYSINTLVEHGQNILNYLDN